MSRLEYPLKRVLQDPVDEAAIHRIAQSIQVGSRTRTSRSAFGPVVAAGLAALVVISLFVGFYRRRGPLTLADGREFIAIDAGTSTAEVDLSDGSHIRLSPGSHLAPLNNSSTTFSAILTRGRADFDVRPGGPHDWVIECGLATVEVVGTAFACERAPGWLRVSVTRGVVLVRGDRVPDRARRLAAGQSLEVVEEAPTRPPAAAGHPVRSAPPPGASSTSAGGGGKPDQGDRTAARAAPENTWRSLALSGRNGEAFAALGVEGFRSESQKLGVNDLLALADVARLSGHPAEAVIPLQRVLTEFSGDPQAPLAAFALGRLHLDSLGRPQAAISALERALALGIPRGLREDVRARLVEAYARSGDPTGARRAADAYFNEYPDGRYADVVSRWLRPR